MRFRGVAAALVAAAVVVVWTACDEAPTEQTQIPEASFAKKAPPDPTCETKGLPVRDYFSRQNVKAALAGLRALTDDCNDSNPVDAWVTGFDVLKMVAVPGGDASDGGEIVAGVLSVMVQTELRGKALGKELACSACDIVVWDAVAFEQFEQSVTDALEKGVFVVRESTDTEEVLYLGDPVWGIEPNDHKDWTLLPYSAAMVYGYPVGAGNLGEDPLTADGFDWSVVPWYSKVTNSTPALAVAACALPSGDNRALVSHHGEGGERLLPAGRYPLYCEQFLPPAPEYWGQRLGRLASHIVPFWPQELNATLLAGKSGSGKPRELSPFYAYSVAPYADYFINTPDFDTRRGEPICFGEFDGPGTLPEECAFAFDWTTPKNGELGGNEIASLETLLITARENNGATVELSFDQVSYCKAGEEKDQILCECDNTELAVLACDRLELTGLKLNKPGGYQLCVTNVGVLGEDQSGLTIEGCTGDFHIKPNAPLP